MQKKFKRKELERLGCSEEEILLVLEYQKRFPILLEAEDSLEKFCIDARSLWNELECPGSQFSKWVSRRFLPYGFKENIDFIRFSRFCLDKGIVPQGGDLRSQDFMVTLDMAKQLAMIGKKESGFIARKYFILMEQIVLNNKHWNEVRDPEKEEYKKMSKAVDDWCFRIWHHNASKSEYAVEADMLNVIVSGKTSAQLKIQYGCTNNELIRDYLKVEHNEELLFLEKQNQVLLAMDMGFTERKNMLTKMHEVTFKKGIK